MDFRSPLSVEDKFRGNDIRILVLCDSLFSQELSMVFLSRSLAKIKAWPDPSQRWRKGQLVRSHAIHRADAMRALFHAVSMSMIPPMHCTSSPSSRNLRMKGEIPMESPRK